LICAPCAVSRDRGIDLRSYLIDSPIFRKGREKWGTHSNSGDGIGEDCPHPLFQFSFFRLHLCF
jgi:hypothetical protein